ncbi:MAG: BMC domain-containing protein [Acidimicrobiales bacterium]
MNADAVGVLEAKGYVPIFDAVDAMVKSSQVQVRGAARLGSGLVAVLITGELAAVEEAIEVGEETARAVSGGDVKSIIFASPSPPIMAIAERPSLIDGH